MNLKKLIILIVLVAIVAYPWWRLKNQSEMFVQNIFEKAEPLGTWQHGDVDFSLSGVIRVAQVQLQPKNYEQTFSMGTVRMETNIWDLFLSSELDMIQSLPPNLSLAASNVTLTGGSNDLQEVMFERDFWPLVTGYLGGFGCGEITDRSFSIEQWREMITRIPPFDMELNYQNVGQYGLNFSLAVNMRDLWYVNWSGTLELTDSNNKFTFQDAVLERLYYTLRDTGFNQKRNSLCQQNHQDSFAAFRLYSAERLQQQLRVFVGQEMSQAISNMYQRSLAPSTEINAIFDLQEKQYLSELINGEQTRFLSLVDIEAAIDEGEYVPIELKKIDYLAMDPDLLQDQYEQKKKREEERLAALNQPKELIKTVKTTIGKQSRSSYINIKDWGEAIGNKVVVKTRRGRPIFGRLKEVNAEAIVLTSQYVTGTAEILVERKNILSLNLVK